MGNFVISLIRTWVPVIVGAVIAWLAAHGLHLDPSAANGAVAFLTAVFSGAYYALVRVLESRYPWLGALLGHTAKPQYRP